MAEIVSCPSCQRKLQIPDNFVGQKVQCPTCSAQFTAQGPALAPPPMRPTDLPSGRGAEADWDQPPRERRDQYDDYDDVVRRRDFMPHRGGAVLTLGILGIVLCGIFTGIPAWVMGSKDLALIREGRMDPSGEGLTKAGYILGIIATILGILSIIWVAFIVIMIIGEAGRGGFR